MNDTSRHITVSYTHLDVYKRQLLRRAARHGKLLGVDHPFLYEVCDTVIHENEGHYPELRERQDYITKVIRVEEENFAKTIDGGLRIFQDLSLIHILQGCRDHSLLLGSGSGAGHLRDYREMYLPGAAGGAAEGAGERTYGGAAHREPVPAGAWSLRHT